MLKVKEIPMLPPGFHSDGNGLFLQVGKGGARSWVLRYQMNKKRQDMGLGSAAAISPAEARELAADARKMINRGENPLEARRKEREAVSAHAEAPKPVTFADVAAEYIAAQRAGWRNPKHAAQWSATLETYAYPVFGNMPVADVATDNVLRALQRDNLWTTKTETASRVRSRIELVLAYAKAKKLLEGENPAMWRGHLAALLPKPGKVKKEVHQPSLPFPKMADFMAELHAAPGTAARALEFAILCASRSGEVRLAQWSEFDLDAAVWVVPAERMKAGKAHRVPLSTQAVALLGALPKVENEAWVFPSERSRDAMSDMALLTVIRRLNTPNAKWIDPASSRPVVPHGFRSSFRDWAAEQTHYPGDMVELALAHTIRDKVEAAYRRGDQFEKRRQLMQDWANFCAPA